MAYETPPTFSSGAILQAAQLNVLSADIEYLYGIVQRVNIPFSALVTTGVGLTSANNLWYVGHQHRYLHYKWGIGAAGDGITRCRIWYNGVNIYEAAGGVLGAGPTGQTSYIDLYGSPGGLTAPTVGTAYAIYFETLIDNDTVFTAYYLIESSLTSLG